MVREEDILKMRIMWKVWLKGASEKELVTKAKWAYEERWVMPFHVPEVIRLGDVQILDAMTNVDTEAWYESENKTEE